MKDFIEWVLIFMVIGVLLFGVKINGKTYQVTCNEKDGVGIQQKE